MWKVFFEGEKWSPQTKRSWKSDKEYDKSLEQKSYEQKTIEDQIWSWLKMLKEKFLKRIPVSGVRLITEVSAVGRKDKLYPLKGYYCRAVGSG